MKFGKLKAITLIIVLAFAVSFALTGCDSDTPATEEETAAVVNITAEQGKTMMTDDPEIVLLDVRTESEFAEEHIKGAMLLPVDELETLAPETIPDKEATYIVYCRSGNRSASAAQILISLGYENVYDMGGIIDWPYEKETGM